MNQVAKITTLKKIEIEYVLAPKMIIFSHGFGVRRDTNGFFTEIARNLPNGYGYMMFDYNDFDPGDIIHISSFSEQVRRLKEVIKWTRQQEGVVAIKIISHSMGCIVTSLSRPEDIEDIILLAPPTSLDKEFRNIFIHRAGAEKVDNYWLIPRSNGTISKIDEKVFEEFELIDAGKVMNDFASLRKFTIINASADEIIKDFNRKKLSNIPDENILSINDANNNFENHSRKPLIDEIIKLI